MGILSTTAKADDQVAAQTEKRDYRPDVKRLLDHHFDAMGIRPTVAEFAAIQGSIVHLLETGGQHPDIIAADERIAAAEKEYREAGKPRSA